MGPGLSICLVWTVIRLTRLIRLTHVMVALASSSRAFCHRDGTSIVVDKGVIECCVWCSAGFDPFCVGQFVAVAADIVRRCQEMSGVFRSQPYRAFWPEALTPNPLLETQSVKDTAVTVVMWRLLEKMSCTRCTQQSLLHGVASVALFVVSALIPIDVQLQSLSLTAWSDLTDSIQHHEKAESFYFLSCEYVYIYI